LFAHAPTVSLFFLCLYPSKYPAGRVATLLSSFLFWDVSAYLLIAKSFQIPDSPSVMIRKLSSLSSRILLPDHQVIIPYEVLIMDLMLLSDSSVLAL